MYVTFTPDMDAAARRLRTEEKRSLQDVADAVGVCRQTLERHADRLGISRRRLRKRAAPLTAEQVAQIRELQPRYTRAAIAQRVGCSVHQVKKWGRGTGLTSGGARKLANQLSHAEQQLAAEIEAARSEPAQPYKPGPLVW